MSWHVLASPARFMRYSERIRPWATALCVGTITIGLYLGLVGSPADYQQGDTVRIMYVHVSSAWLMMMVGPMPMAGAGLFGMHFGLMAPMMTLVLHIIFGAVMGFAFARLPAAQG